MRSMSLSVEARYMQALPVPLVVVSHDLTIQALNPAAETLLELSGQLAAHKPLAALPGFDEALCALCRRSLEELEPMRLLEHSVVIRGQLRKSTIQLCPLPPESGDEDTQLLVTIEPNQGLDKQHMSSWKQEATRTAGVMAAMLAHEVKNPLSGIRGAAQLLQDEVPSDLRPLTELICREVDRVRDLLAQVEVFAGDVPGQLQPVNIHEVLQYVLSIAHTGFGRHVTFQERYDPSLPLVLGHRDLLVQLFLNIVKNASEALEGRADATITLSTAYRSGQRFLIGRQKERVSLPIVVSVEDNGGGISADVRARLFEPFISSKEGGRGLGLAIVAKIASDLGAMVELDDTFKQGTKFVVSLAAATEGLTPALQGTTVLAD